MASSHFLLASFSLAFLCICEANLISDVCSKALNRPLCTQVLTLDPRGRGADLKGLGLIIIEKAETAIVDAVKIVTTLSDPRFRGTINICEETSHEAIDGLNKCSKLLKTVGTKSEIQSVGSAALTNAGTCDGTFGNNEPPNVRVAYKKARDLISILLVIANSL